LGTGIVAIRFEQQPVPEGVMSARISFCLAATLLLAGVGSAGADPLQPRVGTTSSDLAAAAAAADSNTATYNQAGVSDPYNRPGFTRDQSFGLTVGQMLGAAAACEHLHSASVSLDGLKTKKNAGDTDGDRADLDAAQQHMLDPAATMPNDGNADDTDCERMSASFTQLQWIQAQDPNLAKELDQPDALSPDRNKKRPPR